jgi:hypothetical protein
MTTITKAFFVLWLAGVACFASAQTSARFSAADAKDHIGQQATVCGKVVDTKVPKYGITGRGKPVTFDLDQPESNPVFYFIAFAPEGSAPQETVDEYRGKRVCVTGKIDIVPNGSGAPFIMAADRDQIKTETNATK